MSTDDPAQTTAMPVWATSLLLTSLALWIGATAFLTGGVLPALFMNLEPSEAGRIAQLVFPVYFRAGLALGIVASITAMLLSPGGGTRWKVAAALLVVMTLAQAWQALLLHPEMIAIRGDSSQLERFQALHRLSVRLNGVVLGGGALLLLGSGLFFVRRGGDS